MIRADNRTAQSAGDGPQKILGPPGKAPATLAVGSGSHRQGPSGHAWERALGPSAASRLRRRRRRPQRAADGAGAASGSAAAGGGRAYPRRASTSLRAAEHSSATGGGRPSAPSPGRRRSPGGGPGACTVSGPAAGGGWAGAAPTSPRRARTSRRAAAQSSSSVGPAADPPEGAGAGWTLRKMRGRAAGGWGCAGERSGRCLDRLRVPVGVLFVLGIMRYGCLRVHIMIHACHDGPGPQVSLLASEFVATEKP